MSLISQDIFFNFKHFMILERIKDTYGDINLLIRKLITENNGIMYLNTEFFDNFDEKSLGFVQKNIGLNTIISTFRIKIK